MIGAPQPRVRSRIEKLASLAVHGARSWRTRDELARRAKTSPVARALLAVSREDFAPAERRVFAEIERVRASLCARTDSFEWRVEDPVDPSLLPAPERQVVGPWAKVSSVKPHWGRLLYALVRETRPEHCIELGACFGISGLFIQAAQRHTGTGSFVTFEGSRERAAIAHETYRALGFSEAEIVVGDFDRHLAPVLDRLQRVGLAFVDGNHRREATLRYDAMIRARAAPGGVIVHDDIRWSREMIEAWGEIVRRPCAVCYDVFRLGLVELGAAADPGPFHAWLGWSHLR